jgi:5-formyltetrahydrofolate cyclo-ligase
MTKKELRIQLKKIRATLNIEQLSNKIIDNLYSFNTFSDAKNVCTYVSFSNEIITTKILEDKTKNIYVPKIIGKTMIMTKYLSNDLEKNKYGILEPKFNIEFKPKKNDIMILPCLGCNKNFYRLGYGGGFYDKYLQNTNCIKIGLIAEKQFINKNFHEEYDIPLNFIITEKAIYKNKLC